MLYHLLQQSNIPITDEQIRILNEFIKIFIEKNQHINLTKINDEKEFVIKHIIDSLFVGKMVNIKPDARVADLGTGGGLPGIPLAITNPKAEFTLIDSVQKKIRCVEEFALKLDLNNITILSDRLETIGRDKQYREKFDVVIARALANLPTLLEFGLPLVKIGGIFVAMKGPNYSEELNGSANAIKKLQILSATAEQILKYELPDDMGERYLLIFKKTNSTPSQYPRQVGIPEKKPL